MLVQTRPLPVPNMTFLTKERRVQFSEELPQEIHSGHFMVSNLNDSESESEDTAPFGPEEGSKDVVVNPDTSACRDKNRLAFEELESLFKFLDIAYTGKLTTPKWNQFHGMRCAVKYKIRLNNVIWREYHMQFLKNIKPFVVHFQPPPLDNHVKSEVTILEGQYWKRRPETICAEYNRWRKFTRNKILGVTKRSIGDQVDELFRPSSQYSFQKSLGADDFSNAIPPVDPLDPAFGSMLDDIIMDFDENLDLFFGKPLAFPTPKDLALLGIGDIMQPGLLQFQPDNSNAMDDPMLPNSTYGQFRRPSSEQRPIYTDAILPANQPKVGPLSGTVSNTVEPIPQFLFQSATEPSAIVPAVRSSEYDCLPGAQFQQLPSSASKFEQMNPGTSSVLPVSLTASNASDKPGSGKLTILGAGSPTTQDRRDRNHPSSRPFTKHSHQQSPGITPRTHPFKRHRGAASGRPKGHSSAALHQSDKVLKNAFRNTCFEVSSTKSSERERATSETPALLSALLHGTRSPNPTTSVPLRPQVVPSIQNYSTRSVPLLSSVLTSSVTSQAGLIRAPPPDQYTAQVHNIEQPTVKPRYCFSEPHRFQVAASLLADCPKPHLESDLHRDQYSMNVLSNEVSPLSKRPTLPDADNHTASLHSPSFTTQCRPDTSSMFAAPQPVLIGSDGLLSNQQPLSVVPGKFITPAEVCFMPTPTEFLCKDEHLLRTNYSQFTGRRFSDFDGVPQSSGVNPRALPSDPTAAPFAMTGGPVNLSPSSKQSFSMYTPYGKTSRQRTNSGSHTSRGRLLGTVSREELRWPDDNVTTSSSKRHHFFLPSSSVDSCGGDDLMATDMPPLVPTDSFSIAEPSLSVRGRSSSAGNLFPLQQPLMSHVSKPDSINTMSSLGSTEVLSPSVCAQQPLVYTTPPGSPQPSFQEPGSSPKAFLLNNSTEDRRRQLLQTLRQYIKYYGCHLRSFRRSVTRELTRTHNSSPTRVGNCASHDVSYLRLKMQDESTSELLPLLKRPSCMAPLNEDPSRTMSSSEPNSRTSYAATLFQATALIRMLRELSEKQDAQKKSLLNEINSIQTTTTASWEKLDPMGAAMPSRQLTETNLTDPAKEFFRSYTEQRTSQCWKFYVFSLFLWQLFQSYWSSVNSTSTDQFVRSLYGWLDQHCSRAQLRPAIMEALCKLATTTNVLQDPSELPEQSLKAVHHVTTGPAIDRRLPGFSHVEVEMTTTAMCDAGSSNSSHR